MAFQSDPRTALPAALEGDDRALALRDALLQVRTMLSRLHEGDLEGTIDAGGFFGVLLDMLRMDLKHIMELMGRMAEGDVPRTRIPRADLWRRSTKRRRSSPKWSRG